MYFFITTVVSAPHALIQPGTDNQLISPALHAANRSREDRGLLTALLQGVSACRVRQRMQKLVRSKYTPLLIGVFGTIPECG